MVRSAILFRASVVAVCAAITAATTSALAAEPITQKSQTFQFQLGVVIPVKCRLELSAPATAGGIHNPITMRELCNSRSGYQVLATYEQSAMVGASVVLDGKNIPLNDGGQTLIVDSNLPAIANKRFAFVPSTATPPSATLSLAIVAKI